MNNVLCGTIFSSLIVSCFLLCSCGNESGNRGLSFEKIIVNKSAHIDRVSNSPVCKVNIQLMVVSSKEGHIADKINGSIIDKIFAIQKRRPRAAVDSFTNKYLNDYKINYSPFYNEDKTNLDKRKIYKFHYSLKSETEQGKGNILVYMMNENFYEGGSHEISQTIILNFDTFTGKRLTIDDVFVPGYEKKLDGILLDALLTKTGTKSIDELKSKGYLVSESIYAPENFKLGKDGITFIYNPYEIAPYTVGKIELYIDYNELDNILHKNFK